MILVGVVWGLGIGFAIVSHSAGLLEIQVGYANRADGSGYHPRRAGKLRVSGSNAGHITLMLMSQGVQVLVQKSSRQIGEKESQLRMSRYSDRRRRNLDGIHRQAQCHSHVRVVKPLPE